MMNILELPQDCISHVLSLTSPRDVVRSSVLSKQFLSVSTHDSVWVKLLPSDIDDIISKSSSVIPLGSKKELFMHLSDFPILLENNTKSFGLDKRSGKIWYMLGSRALSITQGSCENWEWKSMPRSRFPECAVLIAICWLEIKGSILTTLLSQGTTYGVYFVFKIKVGVYTGFGETRVKGSVSVISEDGLPILGDQSTSEIKSFSFEAPFRDSDSDEPRSRSVNAEFNDTEEEDEEEEEEEPQAEESEVKDTEESREELLVTQEEESEVRDTEKSRAKLLLGYEWREIEEEDAQEFRGELLVTQDESEEEFEEYFSGARLVTQDEQNEEEEEEEDEEEPLGEFPVARDDGWMEVELGRYQVGVNDGDERVVLEMSLKEVVKLDWKGGLAVHGIEIRPLS